LASPATKKVEFCVFVYLKNERNVANWSHSTSNCLLTTYNCAYHLYSFEVVSGAAHEMGAQSSNGGRAPLSPCWRRSCITGKYVKTVMAWQCITCAYLILITW